MNSVIILTAIQLAAENGHAEVVKILLEDDRVDPFAGHNYGRSFCHRHSKENTKTMSLPAMEAASSNGHTEVVQLLRSQRESTEDSSSSDELEGKEEGMTPERFTSPFSRYSLRKEIATFDSECR